MLTVKFLKQWVVRLYLSWCMKQMQTAAIKWTGSIIFLGRTQPGWGKDDSKPGCWPSEEQFIDFNNRRQWPRLDQLISIMNAVKNMGDQQMEEWDGISVDYEPESPIEVPIPAISTPASTSSSDPPVASLPDILASPISCSTGNFSDLAEIWH